MRPNLFDIGPPFILLLIMIFGTGLKIVCISLMILDKANACVYSTVGIFIALSFISIVTIPLVLDMIIFTFCDVFLNNKYVNGRIINHYIFYIYILAVVYLSVTLEMCNNNYHALVIVSDIFHYIFIILYLFYVTYKESLNNENEINDESENENILDHEIINVDENETLLSVNITDNNNTIPNNSLQINIIKLSNIMESDNCAICCANYSDTVNNYNQLGKIECGHIFHVNCIIECMKNNKTCPLCRTAVTN